VAISSISAAGAVSAFSPVNAANVAASVSNTAALTATNPVATSTTIAETYGFAPSLIVPIYQPAFYQPYSQNPDVVTGVSQIEVIPRIGQYPGSLFDTFA
jgi:hypothetical protein